MTVAINAHKVIISVISTIILLFFLDQWLWNIFSQPRLGAGLKPIESVKGDPNTSGIKILFKHHKPLFAHLSLFIRHLILKCAFKGT